MDNISYNYMYKVTYNEKDEYYKDNQYRTDFLEVFNLKEYDEKIIEKVRNEIYSKYKGHKQFIDIFREFRENQKRFPFDLSDETILTFLFSFDYFFYIHRCIAELIINKEISDETYNNLIYIIKN